MFSTNKLENKIKQLEKNKVGLDSLREKHKEFVINNKLIPISQQRFRSEKEKVSTEEVKKIVFRANSNKRIQSINSIETYAYGTEKDLVCKTEGH